MLSHGKCNKFSDYESIMTNLWHLMRGAQISDLGKKSFLFRFFYKMDIEQVTNGTPWNFNNHLLVIYRLDESEDPLKVSLSYMCF